MNIGCYFLLFISEKHYINESGTKEKKENKSKVVANIGDGLFNSVLIGAVVHKLISSLTLMGVR